MHHHMFAIYVSMATSLFVAFAMAAYAIYAGITNDKDTDG
jgi:hypothetical protein